MQPLHAVRLFESQRQRSAAKAVYAILVAVLVYRSLAPQWQYHVERRSLPAQTVAVRDLFDVSAIIIDGRVPPAAARWKRVWIRERGIRIYWTDGATRFYRAASDIRGPATLELRRMTDEPAARRAELALRPHGDGYVLEGDFEGQRIVARLARIESAESPLTTRGFHWISEEPFNR